MHSRMCGSYLNMFYLIATILLNVVISAILKLFPKYGINPLQAIVTNYCVCVVTGCIFIGHIPVNTGTLHTAWLPWAVLMGTAFISIFNLTAYCVKVDGMTTTTIASKLSLVIPVLFSTIVYHEVSHIGKIAGIVLAFPAIYLATRVKNEDNKQQSLFWPAILFVLSGGLDTLVNFIQCSFLTTNESQVACTIVCFGTAGGLGVILVSILALMKKTVVQGKNIVAGICLGIPNYFSIYYLIRTLNCNIMQSSATIPVVNIGILVASSITAILLFGEPAGRKRIIGLVLAITAILLIAFGDK